MNRETIAMVGFGDLGERLATRLSSAKWRKIALRRRAHCVPPGVHGVSIELEDPASLSCLGEIRPEVLLVTLTPQDRSPDGYRAGFSRAMENIVAGLGAHAPRLAMFVSSTRVYAESHGAWVDEEAELARGDPFAGAIIDAEDCLLEALPGAVILRAAGLYGDGPGRLLRRVAAGKMTPVNPPRYSNRMHRDDVAGFMVQLVTQPLRERVYNLADNSPVPQQEVERWLCQQLRLTRTHAPEFSPDDVSAAAPAGPVAHKRVCNSRLQASGYDLLYPSYREGYAAVLRRWTAHSEREDGLDLH